ncbi:MAG TPA: hypothetical protein VJ910_09300 [Desulfuromonadales bacterium]|nr:hypothetical protein [Desulfuromonadales bacterium]
MARSRHFLLIGEAENFRIQVGDNIEIHEAYQRQDLPVALANRFSINGTYQNDGLSRPYLKRLVRGSSFTGEIVQISREEQDLTIRVASND